MFLASALLFSLITLGVGDAEDPQEGGLMLQFREEERDIMIRLCNIPAWKSFWDAFRAHQDLEHKDVADRAVALYTQLRAVPDNALSIFIPSTNFWIAYFMLPSAALKDNSSFLERHFALDCLHGFLAVQFAVALAAAHCCPQESTHSGDNSELCVCDDERLPTRGVAKQDLMKVAWATGSGIALGEHSFWGVTAYDAIAMSGPENNWPLGETSPPHAFAIFKARGQREGWLPGRREVLPSWPRGLSGGAAWDPGCCELLELPPPPSPELRAAIALFHHGEFQQLQGLLGHVATEFWGSPLRSEPYFLQTGFECLAKESPGARAWLLSFGAKAPPASRADFNALLDLSSFAHAERLLQHLLNTDAFLRSADVLAGCSPLWVCVVLHKLQPSLPVLAVLNMALLSRFYFQDELPVFWPWLADFFGSPRVAVCATHRLMAEQVFAQTGVRPAYLPFASLHVAARYKPEQDVGAPVLIWRSAHPAMHFLKELLHFWAKPYNCVDDLIFHDEVIEGQGPPDYETLARHRAVVLIPHVPNPVSLADLYAMGVPIFIPEEPYIYRYLWDYAEPFAGPNARPWRRSRAPEALRAWTAQKAEEVPHPYDPLTFLESARLSHQRLAALPYWYQYTEFASLPALQRFVGVPGLLAALGELSPLRAGAISGQMRTTATWRAAAATAHCARLLRQVLA